MIKTFIDDCIKKARPTKETLTAYGIYAAEKQDVVYSDGSGCYCKNDTQGKTRSVSNLKSLIAAVKEECKRREGQETGKYMTVGFTLPGGYFSCDDNMLNRGSYEYKRQKSALWKAIEKNINGKFSHEDLIILVQNLRLAFETPERFNEVYLALKTLEVKGSSVSKSTPVADGGRIGRSYEQNFDIGKTPLELNLLAPYTKGSEKEYTLQLMILPVTDGEHTYFRIICPEYEMVEEEAILDEIKDFRKEVKDLSEILILEDY